MSASNFRIRDFDTVHHLVSRIAHKVFFLGDDERNDLLGVIRRAAEFGGIRLLGWAIMTNHFHLLVHLPAREEIDDSEVLRRVGVLKGSAGRKAAELQLAAWTAQGPEGVARAAAWFDRQRARMYDIGEFMKIVKQWFTEDYNARNGHVGTLWESVYHDHVVPTKVKDMSSVLGYIHLNPVRAAVCTGYAEYAWSSFSALAKGDPIALEGMRFVYDEPEASASDLKALHTVLLDKQLDGIKRQRAQEIARKRAAGYQMPTDPLTNEALVAQAAAHLDAIQRASMELRAQAAKSVGRPYRSAADVEAMILSAIALNPTARAEVIARETGLGVPNVYIHLQRLKKTGRIQRDTRDEPWEIIKKV